MKPEHEEIIMPSRYAAYGWIVDVDRISESPADSRVGTLGPSTVRPIIQDHFQLGHRPLAVMHWRCKDSDGEIYYEGRYIGPGDERMFRPLEDFSRPDAGASEIEYLNTELGAWEGL